MRKELFAALLFLAPSLSSGNPLSSVGYYNQAAFNQAAAQASPGGGQFLIDNFAGGQVNLPGVSVSSDIDFDGIDKGAGNGHFITGAYTETTQKYSSTVWTFNQPIYAFGGNWNLGSLTDGLQIVSSAGVYFLPSGTNPSSPSAQWSGFWGFVSAVPIESIAISAGDEGYPGNFAQTYTFSNLQAVASAPEPATVALWSLGVSLFAFGSLRKSSRFRKLLRRSIGAHHRDPIETHPTP